MQTHLKLGGQRSPGPARRCRREERRHTWTAVLLDSRWSYHRITAWLGLEGTSVGHPAQPPAQAGSPRAGCAAPRPAGSGTSPEKETPQASLVMGLLLGRRAVCERLQLSSHRWGFRAGTCWCQGCNSQLPLAPALSSTGSGLGRDRTVTAGLRPTRAWRRLHFCTEKSRSSWVPAARCPAGVQRCAGGGRGEGQAGAVHEEESRFKLAFLCSVFKALLLR